MDTPQRTMPKVQSCLLALFLGGAPLFATTFPSAKNLVGDSPTSVVAWGVNDYGQANVPAGLDDVVQVAAGFRHTVALKRDGTVVAWWPDPVSGTDQI